VKVQERRGSENDRCSLNVVWIEKERPEAEQHSVTRGQIGCTLPRPINDQELLFHEKAVGDDRLGTARAK